jgi:hypothetical protein
LTKTLGFYSDVKENFNILYPNGNSLAIFETLIRKYKPKGNRVYDVEIVSIILANGLNTIETANIDDFAGIDEIEIIKVYHKSN